MIDLAATIAINALAIGVLFTVHESGHYLAGLSIGIPRDRLRLRLLSIPPHVALVDGDGTPVSPSAFDRYLDLLTTHTTNVHQQYRFVAGGHVLEWLIVVSSTTVALGSGTDPLITAASLLVYWSLVITGLYLIVDAAGTIVRGYPHGDASGQWSLAPRSTLAFYLVYFGTYLWLARGLGLF
ncbi:hypothetical protein [Natronorubrum tibetense]|uniref:Peptidase M50 n=1 Tax=Natronorubrum tibetense GA33 TaxID=1114856 RepID=L9VL33_9EURY|nr:hypothetical protein [Natronorubrum tibetense]ELY37905.1 hypothetical protein C496_18923 [Natronorubrum tibetense GA33]